MLVIVRPSELDDSMSIVQVLYTHYGDLCRTPLRMWDDGFGPLWLYSESLGALGAVRAQTYEEAADCVIDEILDDPDEETLEEISESDDDDLPEGVYVRSNGTPSNPHAKTPYAAEDPNGTRLERCPDARDNYEYFCLAEDYN